MLGCISTWTSGEGEAILLESPSFLRYAPPMSVFFVLALSLFPVVIILLLSVFRFRISPFRAFLSSAAGLAAVIPITALQFCLSFVLPPPVTALGLLASLLLTAGVIEEGVKAGVISLISTEGVSVKHFTLQALLMGVTLSAFENCVYFLTGLEQAMPLESIIYRVVFLRMVSSMSLHALLAALSSFFIYSAKRGKWNFLPLIYSILLHMFYDFFVYFKNSFRYFALAALLLSLIECRINYKKCASLFESEK